MELTVLERLLLLSVTPQQGNLTTLRIVRDLENCLSFSEEEHAALKFQSDGGETRWEANAVQAKAIKIGPTAQDIVREGLKAMVAALDEQGTLRMDHLILCEKFGIEEFDLDSPT